MRAPAIAAALAVVLASGVAHAADPPPPPAPAPAPEARREPTAGDLTTARTALRDGLALREKGDNAGALARLSTAWDLVQTPITGFELAKTHMLLGNVLQARELFGKVVRLPPSLEESPRSAAAREESARLANELEPRIPSLRIKLTLPPDATAVVRIDDETISMKSNEEVRAVDPGPHDVVAKAGDGPEQTVHVEVAEAEVKDVVLTPQWIAPKPPPLTGPGGQVVYVRTTNPLTFVGFGIAAGGLVVATIGAIVMIDANSSADDLCGPNYCPPRTKTGPTGSVLPGRETAIVDDRFEGAWTRFQAARVAMIAGIVTTVVFGGIGSVFATRPLKEKVVAVTPVVSPNGAGLAGTF
ncbi:MAG: hypothetical protein KIT84_44825 [Labilithrix sp.]|nr:hypothetical protein [Labilithrix sp.]MCW5818206.1 hypothetical protein [Labilithrix sp.]